MSTEKKRMRERRKLPIMEMRASYDCIANITTATMTSGLQINRWDRIINWLRWITCWNLLINTSNSCLRKPNASSRVLLHTHHNTLDLHSVRVHYAIRHLCLLSPCVFLMGFQAQPFAVVVVVVYLAREAETHNMCAPAMAKWVN